eukprot:GFUD01119100.1.p1 GENE.GFUD01119100.1~~GFUD01119100.1.p1  ORF type:complete len:369 (+),score=68.54 GFUD01119100.1:2-1108(+)
MAHRTDGHLLLIVLVCLPFCLVAGNDRPRSALKWISKSEAKKLPSGYLNENLIRPGGRNGRPRLYCRAEVEGCYYPGEVWYSSSVNAECRIITKTKVFPPRHDFQLLYNPEGAAKFTFRPWPEGTGNKNFPLGVVKADEHCNLMLARYNDQDEVGMVDGDGYVYYQHGPDEGWYWDNNEYDLLVERSVTKIELLELDYGDAINRQTRIFEGEGDKSTSETLMINSDNKETEVSTTLSMSYTDHKSWSHSIQVGISVGVEVEVTSPGKALLGGAAARYRFEASFSYGKGWQGGDQKSRTVSQTVTKLVPPRHKIKVKLFMIQNTEDVPYSAKYQLTYDDGKTKTVNDKGTMKNLFYSRQQVDVGKAEPI